MAYSYAQSEPQISKDKKQMAYVLLCVLLCAHFQRRASKASFFMWPLTVLMKQTRQAVDTIKQSIYLDVYGLNIDTHESNLLSDFSAQTNQLKNYAAHSLSQEFQFLYFFLVSLLINHNSNLCNDHKNIINVLPWLAAPSLLSTFIEPKQSKHIRYIRCLWG